MNIDQELRDALRRKEAPANFADRVLERISEMPAPTRRPAPSSSGMRRWLAAAAVLAIAAGGADQYYKQQQAAETARVREELRTALQITHDALAQVQSKLSPPAERRIR
jgi:hypothetical protein